MKAIGVCLLGILLAGVSIFIVIDGKFTDAEMAVAILLGAAAFIAWGTSLGIFLDDITADKYDKVKTKKSFSGK